MERIAAYLRHLAAMPGADALQNIHPLVVHYPIAMLTAAAFVYLLAWAARREEWARSALWMLALGTLGAAVAVRTGLSASDGVMVAPSVREQILVHHKRYMLAVMGLSALLTAWALAAPPLPRRGRLIFLAMLVMMTALLAKGADYGGWMVYGYNAGGSLPQPIEFSK